MLRTAVIGVGYLGRFHAQKYAQLSNAELIGVVDRVFERASIVAEETPAEEAPVEEAPAEDSEKKEDK